MTQNRTTPIGDLQRLADKASVAAVEGTIKAIYEISRAPQTSSRRWTRQDMILTDRTGEIRVKVWNQKEIPPEWKGRHIRIDHFLDDRNRSCDLAVAHNEYQGNVEVQLRVDKRAILTDMANARSTREVGDAYREQRQEREPEREPDRTERRPPEQQRKKEAPTDTLLEAKKLLARYRGLWNVCYDAAVATAHDVNERHGYAMVPGAVGIIADKMFAEMCRKLGHDVNNLPIDPYARNEDGSVDYRGRPLSKHIEVLNEQVAKHRSALPAGTAPGYEPPQADGGELPF